MQYTRINFVDMPNAVQSEISVLNTVNLKLSDPDFFPVIVANQILGGDFNSYLNMNLREKHGWTYGARSSVGARNSRIDRTWGREKKYRLVNKIDFYDDVDR